MFFSKGAEPTAAAIREELGELIYLIRFPLMSIAEFGKNVGNTGILSDEVRYLLVWNRFGNVQEVLDVYRCLAEDKKSAFFSAEPRGEP